MSKYKFSKYNYIVQDSDTMILFNSYNKNLIKFNKNDDTIFDENNINLNKELYQRFRSDGIIIGNNDDEESMALLQSYDAVFNNRLQLTIFPTDKCNFDCKYCYLDFKNKTDMPLEIQNRIIRFLKKNLRLYNKLSFNWFGGEPLAALDVIYSLSEQIIEICHKVGKPYTSMITTNGYNLTLPIFKKLLSYGITDYQVTIDGIGKIHDKYRILQNGQGTFDKIINNLKEIKENIKSSIFTVNIRSNITKESLIYIDEYIEYMYNIFNRDSRFTFYFRPAGNWGGEKVNSIKDEILSENWMDLLFPKLIQSSYTLNYDAYYNLLIGGGCSACGRNTYVIGTNGTIYKCTKDLEADKNKIGLLTKNGDMEINYDKLTKWIIKTPNKKCNTCIFMPTCGGVSCPLNSHNDNYEQCTYEKKSIDYVLRLLSKNNAVHRVSKSIKDYNI